MIFEPETASATAVKPGDGKFAATFRLPIALLNAQIKDSILNGSNTDITLVNPSRAVLTTNGQDIFVDNLSINAFNKVMCNPRAVLTPRMAGPNKVAIKLKRVDFDNMSSLLKLAESWGYFNKEKVVDEVVNKALFAIQDSLLTGINTELGNAGESGVTPMPRNLINLTFDPYTQTIYLSVPDYENKENCCYLNHSCNPNLGRIGSLIFVAKRDIEKNRQIQFAEVAKKLSIEQAEVDKILKRAQGDTVRHSIDLSEGDAVIIIDGPFKDLEGKVAEVDTVNLPAHEPVFAYRFEGTRYDCGSKLGYLK